MKIIDGKDTYYVYGDQVTGNKIIGVDSVDGIETIIERRLDSDNYQFTAGILIADYDQQFAREAIINYLAAFSRESDQYIDFYIPGYEKVTDDGPASFAIEGTKYRFDRNIFLSVLVQIREEMGIQYEYAPLIILQEFINHRMTNRRIVISLNTSKAGLILEEIIKIAHREVSIEAFSGELKRARLKQLLPQTIKTLIQKLTGIDYIEVVMSTRDQLTQYNIKDK